MTVALREAHEKYLKGLRKLGKIEGKVEAVKEQIAKLTRSLNLFDLEMKYDFQFKHVEKLDAELKRLERETP